jgi:hypothetical protein
MFFVSVAGDYTVSEEIFMRSLFWDCATTEPQILLVFEKFAFPPER